MKPGPALTRATEPEPLSMICESRLKLLAEAEPVVSLITVSWAGVLAVGPPAVINPAPACAPAVPPEPLPIMQVFPALLTRMNIAPAFPRRSTLLLPMLKAQLG